MTTPSTPLKVAGLTGDGSIRIPTEIVIDRDGMRLELCGMKLLDLQIDVAETGDAS